MLDPPLLAQLLAAAIRLSGHTPIPVEDLPSIQWLPAADIRSQACPTAPQTCTNMVALFDHTRRRILLSDDLDVRQPRDRSFIVHELVHVLEQRHRGARYHDTCDETLRSERTAYRVQNAYLAEHGEAERFGRMLLQMTCAREQNAGPGSMRLELVPRDGPAFDLFMDDLRRGKAQRGP